MGYCKHCGERLSADNAFCEACGNSVTPSGLSTPLNSSGDGVLTQPAGGNGQLVLGLFAGLVLIAIAVGIGVFVLLTESSLPSAKEYEAQINADQKKLDRIVCLSNFNYAPSQVTIESFDRLTKSWFDMLVGAGLYSGPETISTSIGWFRTTKLRYERTDVGARAVRGDRLCFASKIEVASLTYDFPSEGFGRRPTNAIGHAVLRYVDLAPWTTSEVARNIMRGRFEKPSIDVTVRYVQRDGKWVESLIDSR